MVIFLYLHLGGDTVVTGKEIVGIFDIDITTVSKRTRNFLAQAQQRDEVVNVTQELPKSFVLCANNEKNTLYISQISPTTLKKRLDYFKKGI